MITLFINLMIAILIWNMPYSFSNPIKMSINMLMLSLMIFIKLWLSSNEVWFSLVFTLLFLGGILMMFMILSAVMPNTPQSANMKQNFTALALILFLLSEMKLNNVSKYLEVKSFTHLNWNMILITIMISMFFYSFIYMLTKIKLPLRSNLWCKKKKKKKLIL